MAIQGYDKTSTYSSIATGNVIEASYFTNEFAEIFSAFAKTSSTTSSGHRHDGGDAMGGYLSVLSDSDNDTKITLETVSISSGAPSYTDSDTITIVADGATIATIDSGDIKVAANKGITFGDAGEKIEGDGTDLTISGNNINLTATADVNIPSGVGLTFATAEKIESDGTDLTLTVGSGGDINIPADIGVTFGNDGEKIEGDGTDLTISGNNINLTATADVVIPANVGITFGSGEKIEGDSTDLTVTSGADINLTATSDVNIPANVGVTFGDDGEKIEGDGTDLTISGNNINLTATADVNIPSGVGLTFATAEKIESDGTDLTVTVGSGGDINIPANIGITFGDDAEKIEGDGTDLTISGNNINLTATADVVIPANVGITFGSGEKIEGDSTDLTVTSGADINLTATSDVNIPANVGVTFGNDGEKIEGDGTDLTISGNNINLTATADVVIPANVGITFGSGEKIEGDSTDLTVTSGADINLTATSDVNIPANVGVTFGDDGEKIEGDGTDLTISASALANIDAGTDIVLDAGGGDIFFKDDGTTFGSATNTSGDLIIKSGTTTALTFSGANVTGAGTLQGTTITATTAFVPDASGGADLGSTSLEFGDLYIADDKKIYLGSDQNFSIEYDEDGNDTTAIVASGGVSLAPHGTSSGNTTPLQFQELAANGAHYIGFKAPDSISANVTWTLPNADGSANQVIKTDGSGALSWTAVSSGAVTAINNATANELVTIGSTTTELDAEANLTFDGSTLTVTGALDVTGDITGSTINADGDTAAGDNAAIGYTSAEGLILTGQGSTNDVTIKNDADADVITIATGTTNVDVVGSLTGGTLVSDGDATIGDELNLTNDGTVINFGVNSDITLTHIHDTGLDLKRTSGTNMYAELALQTGETDVAVNDVLGKLSFQAPDEATGTDAILVAAAVQAVSEGNFSSSNNATSLQFMTGASEAATAKMYVKSDGKVGIGTASPSATTLHSYTGSNDGSMIHEANGGNAIFQVRGNRSSATDIGSIKFYNNASSADLVVMRAERHSSGDNYGKFRIGTANSGTVAYQFDCHPTGKVTTTTATANDFGFRCISNHSSTPIGMDVSFGGGAPDDNTQYFHRCIDTSAVRMYVMSDGDLQNADNSYGGISDERIKESITDANSQWADLKSMRVVNYKRKDDVRAYGSDAKPMIGLVAQELESVSPGLVKSVPPGPGDIISNSAFGTLYEDGDAIPDGSAIGDVKEIKEQVKSINYSVLYMKAIKALQEAMARIETLEAKVAALEA